MQAPRLRVGYFSHADSPVDLSMELSTVGHSVTRLTDPSEINDVELVVISVRDEALAGFVEKLASFARRGQMFVHTSLTHGIQVMDPLETQGAIVMAAHPLGEDRWVASATDELGETIVGLLVGELGGSVIDVLDSQRAQLAAALTYTAFVRTLQRDATDFLDEFLHDIETSNDIVSSAGDRFQRLPTLESITQQYEAIEDPGRKRLFRDLARRQAEVSRAQDIELWAIQKEDR